MIALNFMSAIVFNGVSMNILQVIASGGLGGREIQPVKLAEEMKKKGHKTFLLVKNNSQSIPLIKKAKLPYFELKIKGYINPFSVFPFIKILNKNKIDIIHTHLSRSLFFLHLARKLSRRRIKLILTQRISVNVKKDDLFHRYIYTHTDKIIAISEYVKNRLLKASSFLAGKIEIIYNGHKFNKKEKDPVNKKIFIKEFDVNKKDIIIGLVAQLNNGKGHFWVLKSAKILKDKYKVKNFKIFFIGKGKLNYLLKDFVKKYKLTEKVIFTGFRWDVDYFYRNMDIVMVPSKAEAWGNVLIEGMAYEKPVICSDTGAFSEILIHKENGLMVKYDNADDLSRALFTLIKKPALRKTYGKKGRETVLKKFNYDDTVKKYLELYDKVIC